MKKIASFKLSAKSIIITTLVSILLFTLLFPLIMQAIGWIALMSYALYTKIDVESKKDELQPVIVVLENYKKDKGYYPDDLENLVSDKYINALPVLGDQELGYYLYGLSDNAALCFTEDGIIYGLEYCYYLDSKEWGRGRTFGD